MAFHAQFGEVLPGPSVTPVAACYSTFSHRGLLLPAYSEWVHRLPNDAARWSVKRAFHIPSGIGCTSVR